MIAVNPIGEKYASWPVNAVTATPLSVNQITSTHVDYKLRDGVDSSGNSSDLTNNGAGTPFSDPAMFSPNGSALPDMDYLSLSSASYFADIFDLSTLLGENIIIAFTLELGAALTSNETIFCYGVTGGAGSGMFSVGLDTLERIEFNIRGLGETTQNKPVVGFRFNPGSGNVTDYEWGSKAEVVLSLYETADDGVCYDMWVNGYCQRSEDGVNVGTSPINPTDYTGNFYLGARNNGTIDRPLNGSGSGTKISNLKIIRRDSYDENIVMDLARGRYFSPYNNVVAENGI